MAEVNTESGFAAEGAASTYNRLKNDRESYTTRAQNNAALTIPALFPKESDTGSTAYATPNQSIGARGLNNLASKLMLALFPVGTPFFKLNVSELAVKEQSGDPAALTEIASGLAMVERICQNYMESNSYRPALFDALRQLIIAGNVLAYIPRPDGDKGAALKVYKLLQYVVERDTYDNILQIVTLDKMARGALPESLQSVNEGEDIALSEEVEIYTHIYWDSEQDKYLSYQEVDGEKIDGTEGDYPKDGLPWIAVRFMKLAGEDYGRSFVEEYYGDLKSLENLYEAMIKMSMIAAKVLFLVNPNGVTQVRRVAKADTGAFVAGRKQDIEVMQLEKQADFKVAKSMADDITSRLSYAFMLNSAVQRSGDRVTAEEVRYVAGELEDTLGGVYSLLSQELQLPLVQSLLIELQATSKIPNLPQEAVEPAISTGLEALGRGHDMQKINEFIAAMTQAAALAQDPDINGSELKLRMINALGMDSTNLLYTEEQKQQAQAQQVAQEGMSAGAQSLGAGAGMAAAQGTAQQVAQQNGVDPASV